MTNTIELKTSCTVGGRTWKLFDVKFNTADGEFSTYIYALSFEHAEHICEELRNTAKVTGMVCGSCPA